MMSLYCCHRLSCLQRFKSQSTELRLKVIAPLLLKISVINSHRVQTVKLVHVKDLPSEPKVVAIEAPPTHVDIFDDKEADHADLVDP